MVRRTHKGDDMSKADEMTAALGGATTPDDTSRPLYGASFGQAVARFFKRYVQFHGRSSRSEFWWVQLMFFGVSLIFSALSASWYPEVLNAMVTGDPAQIAAATALIPGWYTTLTTIWGLATIIPSLALIWRRLHDSNLAGPWYFLIFVPVAGALALLVFMLRDSRPEGRRFDRA